MRTAPKPMPSDDDERHDDALDRAFERAAVPLTNYSLSTVCPACEAPTFRLACKVRCPRCGFAWDCSEL